MISEKRYHILIWIAVILFAMNLATIGSLFYHTRKQQNISASSGNREAVAPDEQGTASLGTNWTLTPIRCSASGKPTGGITEIPTR